MSIRCFRVLRSAIETLLEETARTRQGHFKVIHRETALKADVYLAGDDELHAWAFERRRRLPLDDLTIWLAPIEYVILRKLEYYQMSGSGRHVRDITLMLKISESLADRSAIMDWMERPGLHDAWRAVESWRLEGQGLQRRRCGELS